MASLFRVRATLLITLVAATLGMTPTSLVAQATGTIRGTVVDARTQRPLGSVQISVPGTNRGTLTNNSGVYLLVNVPVGTATVRAQLIGYASIDETVTVTAEEITQANFQLTQTAIELDALVVTGTAGTTTRRAIGNTVSTIEASQITESAPVNTVSELLQGRTPGLTLMPGAGTAGTDAAIQIRGAGSLNAGNRPVFVIDGVRVRSSSPGGWGVSGQSRSALDAINPEDIESIEVIKGPAAATLYGAEAASGVIQIITKKGRAGQQGVQWNAKAEYGTTEWHLEHPSNYTLCDESKISRPAQWPGCQGVAANTVLEENPLRDDPAALRTGGVRNFNLSARGGGDRYSFYFSGDTEREDGVFYNNVFGRTSGRANLTVTPLDNLDISFNTGYVRSQSRLPLNDNASNGLLRNAYRGLPGSNFPWEEGYRGLGPEQINQYDNRQRADRVILGTTTNWRPLSWFTHRLTLGLDSDRQLSTLFYPIDQTGRAPFGATNARGWIGQINLVHQQYTVDYAGTLNHPIMNELAGSFSAGMQLNAYRFHRLRGDGEGLTANQLRLVGAAAITRADESAEEQNSVGFFVQEQLAWRDRLFLIGALRVDDNSAFGSEFTVATYPKASLSYILSEEPFFQLPYVDQFRLRAAWGEAGNAPAPFSADRTYEAAPVTLQDGTTVSALTTAAFGNPNLKAETGSEVELGFDASLFENRAGVEVTYYNQRTRDALISVLVAPSTGYGGPDNRSRLENVGTISNQGFEVSVFGSPIYTRPVVWDTRLNLSTNSNEMVSFGGAREDISFGNFASVQKHVEGYPLAGYWALDVRRDAQGTPILDERGRVILEDEQFYFGPSRPTRELSLTNTLTLFGNLRLYAFADYKGGHYMWNALAYVRNRNDQNAREVNNPDADPIDVQIRQSGATLPFITPADFIKLRELSATYTLPTRWTQQFGASRTSLTLAGRNLWMWTRYEGTDPEVNFNGSASFTRSDYASVPMLRRLVATVNVTF